MDDVATPDDLWPRERWKQGIYASDLPSWARHVAMVLADHARDSDVVWCGYLTLARHTGLSRSTVIRAMKELVKERWLSVVEEATPARAARYRIRLPGVSCLTTPVSTQDTPRGQAGHRGVSTQELPVSTQTTDLILTKSNTNEAAAMDTLDEAAALFSDSHPRRETEALAAAIALMAKRGIDVGKPAAFFAKWTPQQKAAVKIPTAKRQPCTQCDGGWIYNPDDPDDVKPCSRCKASA